MLQPIERKVLSDAKNIVIKIGSALITDSQKGVNVDAVNYLARTSSWLLEKNKQVAIVSSGAIAEGMAIMKIQKRPSKLNELQALAALGQMSLVQEYETRFEGLHRHSAQILLTHDDKQNYDRYRNASHTIQRLLEMKVIPIINENDVVANDEIRFGDNDRLAALACNMISADVLIIMTDQAGLFTADPRVQKGAELIKQASALKEELLVIATTEGGELGKGGMKTKVLAARQAAKSGTHTLIVDGKEKNIIERVLNHEEVGTFLYTHNPKISAKEVFKYL